MSAGSVLAYIKTLAVAALPGWTVLGYYAPDAADKQLDIGFGSATYGGFVLGGYQVQDTLNLRLFVRLGDNPDIQYIALIDARDAVIKAMLQAANALAAQNIVLFPSTRPYPQSEPLLVASDIKDVAYWQSIIRVPLERPI